MSTVLFTKGKLTELAHDERPRLIVPDQYQVELIDWQHAALLVTTCRGGKGRGCPRKELSLAEYGAGHQAKGDTLRHMPNPKREASACAQAFPVDNSRYT